MTRRQDGVFDRLASQAQLYVYPPEALERLNALVQDKGTVIDVGCGDGVIGVALDAKRVFGVICRADKKKALAGYSQPTAKA